MLRIAIATTDILCVKRLIMTFAVFEKRAQESAGAGGAESISLDIV
jgi:hypothetical protein